MTQRKPLVIFGIGDQAELACHYFESDSDHEVVAFTVDAQYRTNPDFRGRPLVAFQDVLSLYPPDTHEMFIAIGYSGLNAVRRDKYLAARAMGYRLASYISSRATVLNGGRFGDNCFVLEDNTIQPFVSIGSNVVLWSGNHIGHHSTIGDHVFIASHVVVSGGVHVGDQCFIGVNATLRDRIRVGERCVIGAQALLVADAEPEGVYVQPAAERSRVPSSRLRRI